MKDDYIDITFPLNSSLPKWPGSKGFKSIQIKSFENDGVNHTEISLDNHYGTHLDAPLHFIREGKSIEDLDLQKLIGKAYVVEIYDVKSIGAVELEMANIPLEAKKLLFKTDNQKLWKSNKGVFEPDFTAVSAEGAQWLINRGIELVGIDYLSIQRYHDGPETHLLLLRNEVIIVECLKLEEVSTGWYDLICLPILIAGAEGAAARVLVKIQQEI